MARGGLNRRRRKKLAAATSVAAPVAPVLAYGDGVGHVRVPQAALWVAGVFLAIFLAALLASGRVVVPGVVILGVLAALVQPRRGIAVTPHGLLVMRVSLWDGRPDHILFGAPTMALVPVDPGRADARRVRLVIGPERIRVTRGDVRAAARGGPPAGTAERDDDVPGRSARSGLVSRSVGSGRAALLGRRDLVVARVARWRGESRPALSVADAQPAGGRPSTIQSARPANPASAYIDRAATVA